MNEPRGWTFLCIWYENRRFWVHEVKRHYFSFYMALCIPIHLRQRTSRIYQDHQLFRRVLTSFVPPVHNQGVSLAPLQGLCPKVNIPADYWLILCILSLTDLFCMNPCRHLAVDVFPTRSSYLSAFLSRLNSVLCNYCQELNSTVTGDYLFCFCLLCCQLLWSPDITHQFQRVIIHTFGQYRVEYP